MHKPREAVSLPHRTLRGRSSIGEPVDAPLYLPAKPDESNSKCNGGTGAGSAHAHCGFGSVSCVPVNETLSVKFACELKASRKRTNG
jgi:hypothetical protein